MFCHVHILLNKLRYTIYILYETYNNLYYVQVRVKSLAKHIFISNFVHLAMLFYCVYIILHYILIGSIPIATGLLVYVCRCKDRE